MISSTDPGLAPRLSPNRSARGARLLLLAVAAATFLVFTLSTVRSGSATTTTVPMFKQVANPNYPVGTPDPSEPSGEAPPSQSALPGYTQSYVSDFTGQTLPSGWNRFTGIPGGDPGAHFGGAHVVVGGGLLRLNTFRDRAWHNRWVTGGLCQCGLARTYGAYFVRSRVTGPGPNEAELLWPAVSIWPPEIDFSETGGSVVAMSSSVHYGAANHIDQRKLRINMTKWHTWGVIWTRTSITYTVDGQVWGSVAVAPEVPHVLMTLDLEQRTKCSLGEQCPAHSVSMQVDWVAEYTANPPLQDPTTTQSPST